MHYGLGSRRYKMPSLLEDEHYDDIDSVPPRRWLRLLRPSSRFILQCQGSINGLRITGIQGAQTLRVRDL